jgi:hypothetical protein
MALPPNGDIAPLAGSTAPAISIATRSTHTMMSPDIIWYEVTIEDPNVFTRPWKIAMPVYRRVEPNIQLLGTPVTPR